MPVRRIFSVAAGFVATFLLVLLLSCPMAEATESSAPLRVGLLPTNAPLSLLRLYDPFRRYLERQLGRPVELYTARNFRASYDDVRQGTFDLLVTAPHFGVVAVDDGYVPLVRYRAELRPLIVVPKGSALHEASQLRGKKVLTANRLAALSVVAEQWLESQLGLVAGQDYQLLDASSHSTAIRAVGMGDADACISSASVLQQVPEDVRDRVEFFEAPVVVPHQFILAHPRLGGELIGQLQAALTAFPDSPEGVGFFTASGFQGYVPLTPQDIQAMRPYADKVIKMIESKP